MTILKLTSYLESIAPPSYQESYDNAGLITGNKNWEIKGVLLCLDSTEAVVEEAIATGSNLIIAHHPIVFHGLKRLNGNNYVERVIIKAIKNDIAIYACHTNLDNVAHGVNAKICEKLGLRDCRVLVRKSVWKKMSLLIPVEVEKQVMEILQNSATSSGTSFSTVGALTGQSGMKAGIQIELQYHSAGENELVNSLGTVLPDISNRIETRQANISSNRFGSGMIGVLQEPQDEMEFLKSVKSRMKTKCIRHTALLGKKIKTIAVCGGAGGFLLNSAKAAGADVFITSDYKYHEFFDAEGQILIADIGHYESEQFTIELFRELISKKFSTFAVRLTEVVTNPVHYL